MMTPFLLTSTIILLTPGPTNTVLAASGAANGLWQSRLLPLAEAAGYALAISFFVWTATLVSGVWWAMPALKVAASGWLALSAIRLWSAKSDARGAVGSDVFGRVFLTTIFNPKAMIVGTMLIPHSTTEETALHVATFVLLSTLAGIGWVALGSMLPAAIRRHSYKGAAFVLGGFSIAAMTSALA
ncbi:threonine transporter [Rhizobium sp. ARZ01]|uniref:threonine transporter n=1 Tax=Rhizobium sp. ARZ01 TaxID=2769313 RepID=UPI00177AA81A|nr:threonine transporter [Rhizobium sp. ARZ01]MBD9373049.1 threonine transporter [Rhizobium sp. ARZ01]